MLVAESKFSKYLIYASGEIVLVVIGILLALQINSWKIASDNRKIVKKTLIKIKKDLQDDIVNLHNVAKFKDNQRKACSRLIVFFVNPTVPLKDTIQFDNDVMLTRYFMLPSSNETAFEMAKTNGYLNIFINDSLVEQLAKYYSDISLKNHVTETMRYSNSIGESVFEKKYMYYSWNIEIFDGLGGKYKYEWYKNDKRALFQIDSFRRDIQVENYFDNLYSRLTIGINQLKKKEELAEQLIENVDNNIEKIK